MIARRARGFAKLLARAAIALAFAGSLLAVAPTATFRSETPAPVAARNPALPIGAVARLGTSLFVPYGQFPVFSPDGKRLAVHSWDGVHVFDVATGTELFAARLNSTGWGDRVAMQFTEGGEIVAFWPGHHREKLPLLWRIAPDGTATSRTLRERPAGGYRYREPEVYAHALSGDGTRVAIRWGDKFEVLDTTTAQPVAAAKLPPDTQIHPHNALVVLSHDGRLLALAEQGKVRIIALETGRELDSWEYPVGGGSWPWVQFSRDATKVLVTRSYESPKFAPIAYIRDLATKATEHIPAEVSGPENRATFARAGDRVAFGYSGDVPRPVAVWDVTRKTVLYHLSGVTAYAWTAFSPDGKTLATIDREGAIGLWDLDTGRLKPASADPPATVRRLRYLDGGTRLAAYTGQWITWGLPGSERSDRFIGTGRAAELSPDGTQAARLDGSRLVVLDTATGGERWARDLTGVSDLTGLRDLTRVRYSSNGSRLVTCTNTHVRVWDALSGTEIASFPIALGQFLVAVSPDAREVAVAYSGPQYGAPSKGEPPYPFPSVHDTATGKRLWSAPRHAGESPFAQFSADGRLFVYVSIEPVEHNCVQDAIVVCDAATGQAVGRIRFEGPSGAWAMALSPDGRLVAFSRMYGEIDVHSTATGRLVGRFRHRRAAWALAFSPDGKTLAAASIDAPVYLWDVSWIPLDPR